MTALAVIFLLLGAACALGTVIDIFLLGHRQKMWVMNVVWPITMLWASLPGALVYFLIGRASKRRDERPEHLGENNNGEPAWPAVARGTTHCGAGCTMGDLTSEVIMIFVPIAGEGARIASTWSLDYVMALAFGIFFQYYAIAPRRHLSWRDGIKAALRADVLSLTAWQVGMYGWMALVLFLFFPHGALAKSDPRFWLMMQIAMFFGFATSYPINKWLIKKGYKESM